jgi:hypothetical protein
MSTASSWTEQRTPAPARIRNALVNAALAGASTFLAAALFLGAGEAYLRLEHGAVPPGPPTDWNIYDPRRGWALVPGAYTYFDVKAARRVEVQINDFGIRNASLTPSVLPGVHRVTVLGDSFVFGPPLMPEETITGQLQAMAGPAIEVVNAAVPGYGTGQQYRLMQELVGRGYQPGRQLILMFFTNDLQDNLGLEYSTLETNRRQPVFEVDASGQLTQTTPQAFERSRGRPNLLLGSLFLPMLRYNAEVVFASHPALSNFLQGVGLVPSLPRTPGIVAGWYGAGWESRWQVTAEVLSYVLRQYRAMPDAPTLHLVFIPSPFQVQAAFRGTLQRAALDDERYARFLADPDRPQRVLAALAARLDVGYSDLTPALRVAAQREPQYFAREGHFNAAGCATAARILLEEVLAGAGR